MNAPHTDFVRVGACGLLAVMPPVARRPRGRVQFRRSVDYTALEQVRGEPIDHRADIFALGVVVHEMRPGLGRFSAIQRRKRSPRCSKDDAPDLSPHVTPALARVVRRCRQQTWKNILPRDPAGIMAMVSFRVTSDGRAWAFSWHRALSNLYVADELP